MSKRSEAVFSAIGKIKSLLASIVDTDDLYQIKRSALGSPPVGSMRILAILFKEEALKAGLTEYGPVPLLDRVWTYMQIIAPYIIRVRNSDESQTGGTSYKDLLVKGYTSEIGTRKNRVKNILSFSNPFSKNCLEEMLRIMSLYEAENIYAAIGLCEGLEMWTDYKPTPEAWAGYIAKAILAESAGGAENEESN